MSEQLDQGQAATTGAVGGAPEQQVGPDLTVQDLANLRAIIDVASQRGAFKPNEMVAVGTIYSKLEKFLTLAQKQSQPAAQQGQAANA